MAAEEPDPPWMGQSPFAKPTAADIVPPIEKYVGKSPAPGSSTANRRVTVHGKISSHPIGCTRRRRGDFRKTSSNLLRKDGKKQVKDSMIRH